VEETDLLEPTLLDELICHISSLASVYHKPPTAFVEGRGAGVRKSLPNRAAGSGGGSEQPESGAGSEAMVIPNQESLIGDLLSMDINAPAMPSAPAATSNVDLLGGGLDILLGGPPAEAAPGGASSLLGDIFGLGGASLSVGVQIPKVTWLPAEKGKGLEIQGTFSRRNGEVFMDMTLTNKAMQPMTNFAIQLNKNSFGLVPASPMQAAPLPPNQSIEVSMALGTNGPIQRMEPLNNLQVAVKNNIDIFYFACLVHGNVLFAEDGQLDKRVFLNTWKEIPAANELQYSLSGVIGTTDGIASKMTTNNIFTIAKRNVEGQDMLYQSLKLTNSIWVLLELKLQPGNPDATLSLKSRSVEVANIIFAAYEAIIRSP